MRPLFREIDTGWIDPYTTAGDGGSGCLWPHDGDIEQDWYG